MESCWFITTEQFDFMGPRVILQILLNYVFE